ncbi:IS5 family transposase [Xenorhabdus sp. SF857]|uniref:IS5 family transposase n=1 Tax=Xenorhabdus bakwenae TaxID=3026967 RepID=UPI002557C90B|nr:IS5 family transposase [Xenorhabdus sp. SF857]WFQ78955.1 IS5 family transposase [Xenorhabdus sp. SF857]
MRKVYPSDITREQFEQIRSLLEQARKRTASRKIDLYEVFCGLLYLLKSGCQWRMLPSDFPKWRTVHYDYQIWSEPHESGSVLALALKKSGSRSQTKNGRDALSTFLIVDAQSVNNTDTAKSKGYDAGKKISGIKRHIVVDSQGLPHAMIVTTANVTDREGALDALAGHQANPGNLKCLLADGGYTGDRFALSIKLLCGATVQIAQRHELHRLIVIPKRWVVERSFSGLEKCRRLWKNCERKLNTSLQMINLAFLVVLLKRL